MIKYYALLILGIIRRSYFSKLNGFVSEWFADQHGDAHSRCSSFPSHSTNQRIHRQNQTKNFTFDKFLWSPASANSESHLHMAITHNPVTHPHPQMRKSNLCSAIQLWNVRHHAMVLPSSSTRKDFPSGRPPLLRPPPGSASCSKVSLSSLR